MAPAPRTTISRMAAAVWRKFLVATIRNSCGSNRCSISSTTLRWASKVTVRKCRVRPRTVTFILVKGSWNRKNGAHGIPAGDSTNLDFQPLDFVLNLAILRLSAKVLQVRVAGQPGEIAVAQLQGAFQGKGGAIKLASERITAGQIVKDHRLVRLQPRQTLVQLQPFQVTSALRVKISQQFQRVHVIGVPADETFEELDFDVEVARVGAAHFFPDIAVHRHTRGNFSKGRRPVKVPNNFVAICPAVCRMSLLERLPPDPLN